MTNKSSEILTVGGSTIHYYIKDHAPGFCSVEYFTSDLYPGWQNAKGFEDEVVNLPAKILSDPSDQSQTLYTMTYDRDRGRPFPEGGYDSRYISVLNNAPVEFKIWAFSDTYSHPEGTLYRLDLRAICGISAADELNNRIKTSLTMLLETYCPADKSA